MHVHCARLLPVMAAALLASGCTEQVLEPEPPLAPAFAKKCASPPCGGDGGDEEPPAATPTVLLSGGYTSADAQPVETRESGKTLRVTGEAVTLTLALPAIGVEAFPAGTCTWSGALADDADAAGFWNAQAAAAGAGRNLQAQVDKKSLGSPSSAHWTQVFWAGDGGIEGGNLVKMKGGNHTVYGAATYTPDGSAPDTYTLTDGGLTLSVLGGDGNHEIAGVSCSTAALGATLTFQLLR
jgi:hypothetical protein